VRTRIVADAEGLVVVGGERIGGGDDVSSGLDLYRLITAGGADELPGRPAGPRIDSATDGQSGEYDRQVGLDRVTQVQGPMTPLDGGWRVAS
jgi:hypothetical protein